MAEEDNTTAVAMAVEEAMVNDMDLYQQTEEAIETATSVSSEWAKQWDDATGKFFYTNVTTGEATWDEPPAQGDGGGGDAAPAAEQPPDETTSGVWIAQYDPTAARAYYYHTATGVTQWELPDGFVDMEYLDDKMSGAVKIQSAFRSKKARNRVKELNGTSRPQSAASTEPKRLWRQHFDPRSQQYYYYNLETGDVTWEKPSSDVDCLTDTHSEGDSATKIQCVFRKRAASKVVEEKKQLIRDLTSDAAINQKLQDIMRAVDDIENEVEARRRTLESSNKALQLQDKLQKWADSASQLRDRVLDHHHHAQLVQQLDATGAERLVTAQQFHDAMAATRSDCLGTLKDILLTDHDFIELEVIRVNEAYQVYSRCKDDPIFRIPESKVRAVIRVDEAEYALSRVEKSLRKAMGMTDFSAGATTSRNKVYNQWRAVVTAIADNLRQLQRMVLQKKDLLVLYEQSLVERRETDNMSHEDQLSNKQEEMLHRTDQARIAHARFLEVCRERWQKGLQLRQDDSMALRLAANVIEKKKHEDELRIAQINEDYDQSRARVKLSIWEAAREGCSVDAMRGMMFAEMQKARQNGFEFDLRTARSSRGETLVQIACWGGHTELVSFLLDEGADLRAIDSISNGFTLLHDAARRGDSLTTRLLVTRGLEQDAVDRSGDTPLHWAVRKNHYEAVHTLLGAYMHKHDPEHNQCALRAVRSKNNRGRKPIDLAKSDCIRRLLQAFDEGRICCPQQRNRSNSKVSLVQQQPRRLSETSSGQTAQTSIRHASLPIAGATLQHAIAHLAKASTTSSLLLSKTAASDEAQPHGHEEDEFGMINVGTSF